MDAEAVPHAPAYRPLATNVFRQPIGELSTPFADSHLVGGFRCQSVRLVGTGDENESGPVLVLADFLQKTLVLVLASAKIKCVDCHRGETSADKLELPAPALGDADGVDVRAEEEELP
ncbi:hypothetical protein EFR84_08005 [Rhizobium chutanense]|uniref:Uncharacterized protein n=1 Tax=Rhizobium chutanense TaxID=2035448 RepID=A0A3S0T513_9HYPH|nr:hypothetical protein EFR84_08005 [Rhizobium chutanense]